jgi:hypothetical protein
MLISPNSQTFRQTLSATVARQLSIYLSPVLEIIKEIIRVKREQSLLTQHPTENCRGKEMLHINVMVS